MATRQVCTGLNNRAECRFPADGDCAERKVRSMQIALFGPAPSLSGFLAARWAP